LESFAAGDEAGAAGPLVNYGGGHGFFEIIFAGSAAAVDEPRAAPETVGHLIAAEIDGVVAGQLGVDALVEPSVTGIAHIQSLVAPVILRQLLLDDVGLNGDTEMIGLTGEVGGEVIVLVLLEGTVAKVAPQHGGHTEFVGLREGLTDFYDLAVGVV